MRFTYDDPVTAVLLRLLAWECYVAKKSLTVKEAVTHYVQLARADLGLEPYRPRSVSGGADAFIQGLRRNKLLPPIHSGRVEPHEPGWKDEWRLLYLPPHEVVRQLSIEPVLVEPPSATLARAINFVHFTLTLRNPAVPSLDIYVGKDKTGSAFPARRGLYFIGRSDGLYIGATSEFGVRSRQHTNMRSLGNVGASAWYVFMSPVASTSSSESETFSTDDGSVTLDALLAAEGMLISFWNEVSTVLNDKRGSDRKPETIYLQQAVLLEMGVSAAFIWLVREGPSLGLPIYPDAHFKPSNKKGWPKCYLEYAVLRGD